MNKKYCSVALLGLGVIAATFAATSPIFPVGVGSYSAWAPSTGAVHYTLVDETSCNGTTDYVSTNVAGSRDSYAVSLATVPDGSTITAIAITPCASKDKTLGFSVMDVFYRLNGVNSTIKGAYKLTDILPTVLPPSSYSILSIVKNASTSLEIGTVLSSGSGGARLSQISTVITYTPPVITLTAPSNLSGTGFSSSTFSWVTLTWADNSSNENGFLIERGLDGTNFGLIATTTENSTRYNDFSVIAGTTYYYRVRAFNAAGLSAYSSSTAVIVP